MKVTAVKGFTTGREGNRTIGETFDVPKERALWLKSRGLVTLDGKLGPGQERAPRTVPRTAPAERQAGAKRG